MFGGRSVDPSSGTSGDFGLPGGQGGDAELTTPSLGTSPNTNGSMSTESVPKVVALLSPASAFPISLAHNDSYIPQNYSIESCCCYNRIALLTPMTCDVSLI